MSWSDLAWPRVAGLPVPQPQGKPPRPLIAPALLARMAARRERAARRMGWLVTLGVAVTGWHVFILHAFSPLGWVTLGVILATIGVGILILARQIQGQDLSEAQRVHWLRYRRWQRAHAAWLAVARQTYQERLSAAQRERLQRAIRQSERAAAAVPVATPGRSA